jgi:hypothetical protein
VGDWRSFDHFVGASLLREGDAEYHTLAAAVIELDKENPRSSGDKIGGVKWGFIYINGPTISPRYWINIYLTIEVWLRCIKQTVYHQIE